MDVGCDDGAGRTLFGELCVQRIDVRVRRWILGRGAKLLDGEFRTGFIHAIDSSLRAGGDAACGSNGWGRLGAKHSSCVTQQGMEALRLA